MTERPGRRHSLGRNTRLCARRHLRPKPSKRKHARDQPRVPLRTGGRGRCEEEGLQVENVLAFGCLLRDACFPDDAGRGDDVSCTSHQPPATSHQPPATATVTATHARHAPVAALQVALHGRCVALQARLRRRLHGVVQQQREPLDVRHEVARLCEVFTVWFDLEAGVAAELVGFRTRRVRGGRSFAHQGLVRGFHASRDEERRATSDRPHLVQLQRHESQLTTATHSHSHSHRPTVLKESRSRHSSWRWTPVPPA